MSTRLSKDQQATLHKWLNSKGFPNENIHLLFSDGCEVARLISTIYPKLIDVNNYLPRQSILLKVNNWSTLNNKVLAGLKLYQNKAKIEAFAAAKPGVIDTFLYKIMLLEREEKPPNEEPLTQEEFLEENGDIITIKVRTKVGGQTSVKEKKLIKHTVFDELVQETELKKASVAALEQRISQLEALIKVKDNRIAELDNKIKHGIY